MTFAATNTRKAIAGAIASLAVISYFLAPSNAVAADAKTCRAIFRATELPQADLRAQAAENYSSDGVEAFKKLETLRAQRPELAANESLLRAIEDLLRDEEFSVFHKTLGRVFDKALNESPTQGSNSSAVAPRKTLKDILAEELARSIRKPLAEERAAVLESTSINKQKLQRALHLTLEETLEALVGPRGIENVAPGSLVSRYLSLSKRAGVNAQTIVARFKKGPPSEEYGNEKRLFIAVDAKTAPIAQRLFADNPHFLIHEHEPEQGTLQMHHAGRSAAYGSYHDGANALGMAADTIAPLIALSTTEASRTENYFQLGKASRYARAKYPWSLKNREGESIENYCRPGGYTSCTHWIGEMPIGDRLVETYSFPGQFDAYADQADPLAKRQQAIRTGPVGRYTHFEKPGQVFEDIGTTSRLDRLTRLVWKQGQGNQQLWQMLRARSELSRGEFANPGWVLYTLLSEAPAKRVPVVLIYRDSAAEPLTQADIDRLTFLINPT